MGINLETLVKDSIIFVPVEPLPMKEKIHLLQEFQHIQEHGGLMTFPPGILYIKQPDGTWLATAAILD